MGDSKPDSVSCGSVGQFKQSLKSLRLMDDKIIYELNKSVPTQSFAHEVDAEARCGSLYKDLLQIYNLREQSIKGCIASRTENIENIRAKLVAGDADSTLLQKTLRSEQSLLKAMQSELLVEEVVKKRSLKVFNERCWQAYDVPS